MAEPEDLILDGAYMASRLVRDVWRRYVPPAPDRALRLGDIRVRLELFLNALFESSIPVSAAELPAPVSWLARLAGRAGDARAPAVPGTDGHRIFLPDELDAPDGIEASVQTHLLLAVEQALRLVRGSTSIALAIDRSDVRDWFAIADAAAVDDWIVHQATGLVPPLRDARQKALMERTGPLPRDDRERAVESAVRRFLASDPHERLEDLPLFAIAADAHDWARRTAHGDYRSYRSMAGVWYWGRARAVLPGIAGSSWHGEERQPERASARRVADMRRRPRIREAAADEDDSGTGTWVIRPDEPQETVEDPFGLQRPADRANDVDPESLGDSLSELPEARVVRTPGLPKEILRSGDELPRTPRALAVAETRSSGVSYPEWDYRRASYRTPGAIVRETVPQLGDPNWAARVLTRHRRLVCRVRARFERLRPHRIRIGRQADGPELDVAEYVTAAADFRAGVVGEDRLYLDVRPGRRELSVALLVDVSASTDSWVSGHQRIVDVEKDALLVVCEALGALGDRYAIFAFAGESAEHVKIVPLKRFSDRSAAETGQRIAGLESDGYTRIGAAIRYATGALSTQLTDRRLLLVLSDGKPNDVDAYEGPYGVEDARQAVAEARMQDVAVFCLTVDREAPRYASRIFGRAGFTVLRRPDQLPEVLIDVLRRLIHPCR